MRTWIKNGTVITPQMDMLRADILIEEGKIITIGNADSTPDGATIDAAGCIVAPGLVDVHAHFRDPGFLHKEDIHTGAKAAAKGGFTTVVLMANTNPPVDNVETLSYVLGKGKKTAIHIHTCAAATRAMQGRELTDMETLKQKGAAGYTDDGIPILDAAIVHAAMQEAHRLHMPLSLHEENPALIANNGIHHGKASAYYGIAGSPREAEISLIERDLQIAAKTGATVNIQHVSTKEAVALIREAKKKNPRIHAEAAPHHFALTEEAAIQYGTLAKMNPPLRTEEDRLAIIQGLRDNVIDLIATDHAPHSREEKEKPLTEAPNGIIGLETALALGITCLVRPGFLTIAQLMERMSFAPAALYGLNAGRLTEGGVADIVIFDPQETWTVGDYASKSSNSPFTGQTLYGKVKYTICDGNVIYSSCGQP